MTLGVASLLVDAGNGVGLVDHVGAQHRVLDLWLVARIIERLEVEVKTPLALRAPGPNGLQADAIKLVAGLIDKAASSKTGQLDPLHSGIVAIGSFHLGQQGLDQLESAVSQVLERQAHAKRKPHLIAVVVFEVSYQITAVLDGSGMLASSSMSPAINHRFIVHPGYEGTLSISRQTPWQAWGEVPSQKT